MFTCTAVGVPQPSIKWLIGSREVTGDSNVISSSTLNSITVQSSLRRTMVTETETGPVSCIAYHSYNGELFLATTTANLIVLSKYGHVYMFGVYIMCIHTNTIKSHILVCVCSSCIC